MRILEAVQELFAEGPYAGIPIVTKGPVYHVGNLDKKRKVGGTGYEGDGLPVSEYPKTWSSIARLGSDLWYLNKKSGKGRFMNMLAAMKNKALKSRVVAWATNNGWATQGKVWQASWYDDEWEDTFTATYGSKEEAEQERGEDEIKEVSQLVATQKLQDWWISFTGREIDLNMVEEMLFYLFARDQTDLDGVWWNEVLDPSRLSAPRGSIFQDRLKNWDRKKITWEEGPDEDEER
jgi:hypothetical protein